MDVDAGVVTLSGAVPTADDAVRAVALAQRLEGAVTVENQIERDLSVDENLAPALSRLRQDINGIVRVLPLVAIALGIGVLIAVGGHFLAKAHSLWRWAAPNEFLADLLATGARCVARNVRRAEGRRRTGIARRGRSSEPRASRRVAGGRPCGGTRRSVAGGGARAVTKIGFVWQLPIFQEVRFSPRVDCHPGRRAGSHFDIRAWIPDNRGAVSGMTT